MPIPPCTFKLNVELYPKSANCYVSLYECYWKIGKLNLAIKNYEGALAMDPAGRPEQTPPADWIEVNPDLEKATIR